MFNSLPEELFQTFIYRKVYKTQILDLTNEKHVLATLVLLFEIILYILLLFARYYARRLKLETKLMIIYSIVPLNIVVWLGIMAPKGFRLIDGISSGQTDPLSRWYIIVHATFGFFTMTLAISILLFMLPKVIRKNKIPLSTIRKVKPLMITVFICWTITVTFGVSIYIDRYLFDFL